MKRDLLVALLSLKHLLYPDLFTFDVEQHHLYPHVHRTGDFYRLKDEVLHLLRNTLVKI